MPPFFKPRSAARVIAGRSSKLAGDAFEIWLSYQHEEAIRRGFLACVEKSEPHAKILSGRVVYTAKGVADYFGTLAAGTRSAPSFSTPARPAGSDSGGLSFVAEAKSTADERLARAVVSQKQSDHLDAVARAGGLALLLCEFRAAAPTRCAIPWAEVPWRKLRTADSLGRAEVGRWIIAPGENYFAKFLTVGAA